MPAIEILVDGLDHPECVCWDPGAELLWAGGEAGQLYRVDLAERRAEEIARAPGFVLGVAADGRGRVVACCSDEGLLCVLDDGGGARGPGRLGSSELSGVRAGRHALRVGHGLV